MLPTTLVALTAVIFLAFYVAASVKLRLQHSNPPNLTPGQLLARILFLTRYRCLFVWQSCQKHKTRSPW